jgi:hypothetical protein
LDNLDVGKVGAETRYIVTLRWVREHKGSGGQEKKELEI